MMIAYDITSASSTSLLLLTVWVVITVEMWPAMTC